VQELPRRVEEGGSGLGEGHVPAGAFEQRRANRTFESLDPTTDDGLREVQSLSRPPEVPLLGHGDEHPDQFQIAQPFHAVSISVDAQRVLDGIAAGP
jgi:hypothetical protein